MPEHHKEIPSESEILWSRLSPFKERIAVPGILDIMMRTILVGSANKEIQTKKSADFNFRPPVGRFGLLEFDAIDEIVEVGYRYAKDRIKELKIQETLL
jgi:predicted acylesterase/phospholipase RssA